MIADLEYRPGDTKALNDYPKLVHPLYVEMLANVGYDAKFGCEYAKAKGDPFGALYIDDKLVCVGGIMDESNWFRGVRAGAPWWYFTTAIEENPRYLVKVLRGARQWMDRMDKGWPCLYTWYWTKYPVGRRLSEACGFEKSPTITMRGAMETRDAWRFSECAIPSHSSSPEQQ